MKQVKPHNYNQQYFSEMFISPDYHKRLTVNDFSRKYQEVGDLLELKSTDSIVDFGCGNGDLCFYLSLRYGCQCIGVDYSKSAIDIANKRQQIFLKQFPKSKIKFYNRNNDNLPKLKNIRSIYLIDVVEHMYDKEIKSILREFESWGGNQQIIIHTDNNLYLRFIHPIIYFIQWYIHPSTRTKLLQNLHYEKTMHINLTNQYKFTQKMKQWGYDLQKLTFPTVSPTSINNQIGIKLPKIITYTISYLLKHVSLLFPSFYAVYFLDTPTSNCAKASAAGR